MNQIEFSKRWVEANGVLFAGRFLQWMAEHPAAQWSHAITQTDGFVTLTATPVAPATGHFGCDGVYRPAPAEFNAAQQAVEAARVYAGWLGCKWVDEESAPGKPRVFDPPAGSGVIDGV